MANQNPLSDRDWLHVKQQFKRYVRREEYKATLGDIGGVLDEPGYPGYVRVRYSQQEGNLSQPTTLPFEANMIKQTGAAVIVGYDDNGDLAILRPDVATQRTQGVNTLGNNASDPNVTYYIGQQRIITLNSHPISSSSASMVVTIQNWLWIKGGVAHYFTGGDGNEVPIDLTSFIPSSANMECLACLFIKPDNTVEVIASTPKNAAIGVDIADVQECLDGSTTGGFPVWAWRLYHGQVGITPGNVPSGGDDFLDLRQFINVVMDSAGGSLTVTDGSTTVTDVTDITFNGSDFTVTDLGGGSVQIDAIITGGSTKVQLNYAETTDLSTPFSLAAATWTDLLPNQSFTVDNTLSVIEISITAGIFIGTSSAALAGRFIIDSAGTPITIKAGAGYSNVGDYSPVLAGSGSIFINPSTLAAGSHTIKLQVYALSGGSVYCRCSSVPDQEFLNLRVIEHKN